MIVLSSLMDSLYVYGRFLLVSVRAQMQYRASFLMQLGGRLIITIGEFGAILVLFNRFGMLLEWEVHQVAFFYGVVNISFALADAATTGFDTFGDMVKSGDFDRVLVRPRATALQLAGQELTLRRVSRLAPGGAVLVWASVGLDIDWSVWKGVLLAGSIVGGASIFAGLIVLQATLAFWTTETLEIVNAVTYGGVETTQYPMSIYRPWFRRFFTFGIPLACVSYFPSLAVMGVEDPLGSALWFQYVSPLVGVGFLGVSLWAWRFGVRHYVSTGS